MAVSVFFEQPMARNAARDTAYTILSNIEDISFEQAWKASGLSSDLNDYFETEDAVFVAIKLDSVYTS